MTILPLPKSIATVSISGTLAEKMEAAAAIGFDGVEIFENDLLTFEGSPDDVRYLAESLGLAITCFQPFRDFESMPEPQRSRNMDRAERKFDVMQATRRRTAAGVQQRLPASIDDEHAPPLTWRNGGTGGTNAACASGTKLWPGAATSTAGATPGRSCSTPTTPRSA